MFISIACKNIMKYTGCQDQIGRALETILLHNQKICRIYKDSFENVRNRAMIYGFS